MAVKMRRFQAKQRQLRLHRLRKKQLRAKLGLNLRRALLKDRWLRLRRRINRWLVGEGFVYDERMQKEIYVVKGYEPRGRETRVSER